MKLHRKVIFLILFLSILGTQCYSKDDIKSEIVHQFIKMHNDGTEDAIKQFINKYYGPDLVQKISIDSQIDFYRQIIDEFGPLNTMTFKEVSETETKLVVQLIRHDGSNVNRHIPDTEILVVEVDITQGENYLNRGLGLGSLACEKRK